jgi:osmotically-inducible protein OsmY
MKTDSQIQREVRAKLRWEPAVDQTAIGVEVKDRIVTLSGQVASFDAKHAAENAALNVLGVKALTVEMEVALVGRGESNDRQIARAIELAVTSTPCLPAAMVKIMVEEGFVTLLGEVESVQVSSAFAEAASNVVGVRGVRERMIVKAPLSPATARAETVAELELRCGIDKDDIAVQTF